MDKNNEDKLEAMLLLQKSFQNLWNLHPKPSDVCTAMASEALELWVKSRGKWWSEKKYSRKERLEELVDILHFFLCYMVEDCFTAQELFNAYKQKLAINHKRQEEGY